jgi:hypothetical protein
MESNVATGVRLARVALPATCGELVQRTLDGVPCLVSCPIGRYSVAEVWLQPRSDWEIPPDAPKAAAALRAGHVTAACYPLVNGGPRPIFCLEELYGEPFATNHRPRPALG